MEYDDHIEIDIHVHKFNNAAKSAVHMLSSRCSEMYMEIGILVESREEDELPEVLRRVYDITCPHACIGQAQSSGFS